MAKTVQQDMSFELEFLDLKINLMQANSNQNVLLTATIIFIAIAILAIRPIIMAAGVSGAVISLFGFIKASRQCFIIQQDLNNLAEKKKYNDEKEDFES